MQQRTSAISVLDTSIIGHIKLTLTNWTNTFEPETAAGSSLEIGGSLFYATGNDDLDVAGAWGGIANSTLVYVYYGISGTNTTQELSITAPTWDTAKQGWYNAAMTKRCPVSIFKDAAGNYTQKTILLNREHGLCYHGINLGIGDSTGTLIFDQATDCFENLRSYKTQAGGADIQLKQYVSAGDGADASFIIKKPVSCYLLSTVAGGAYSVVQMQYSGGWIGLSYSCDRWASAVSTRRAFNLVPGTYRLYNTAAGTATLYGVGVYGLGVVTVADIVT